VEGEQRSLVIEKRGTPRAVLLSIRDYVKLAPQFWKKTKIISSREFVSLVASHLQK
jgi:hypothetical protein